MKRALWLAILALACSGSGPLGIGDDDGEVNGNRASWHDIRLALLTFQDNWTDPDPDFPDTPDPGFRFATIEAEVTNGSDEAYINAVGIDFDLKTSTNEQWDPTFIGRDPALPSTTLAPGQAVRGWLTFEIPVGATVNRIVWHPTFDVSLEVRLP